MNLIEQFTHQLSELYRPSEVKGIVQLKVKDCPEYDHYHCLEDTITTYFGSHPQPNTTISAPLSIYQKILDNPTTFEPRADIFTYEVDVTGDLPLMHLFTQLLKRPLAETQDLLHQLHEANDNDMTDVLTAQTLTETPVLEAILQSRPTKFSQSLNWPAMSWDINRLNQELGDCVIRKNPVTSQVETMGDLIRLFEDQSKERVYSNGCVLPAKAKDHFKFPLFDEESFRPMQLWFGKKRPHKLITKLHCDFVSSFLIQVWGRKKIALYPPSQHKYLYPYEAFNIYQPCKVDPAHLNYQLYPEFEKAKPIYVTIEPGDLLIIPAGWYHCVWALDDVLSVSRFMDTKVAQALSALE